MRIFIFVLFMVFFLGLAAQKGPLDHLTYKSWPLITHKKISGDGKYICYIVGSADSGYFLTAQATDGSWKKEIRVGNSQQDGIFTKDNERLVFSKSIDSICILKLGTEKIKYIGNVRSYKMVGDGNGEWLGYQLKGDSNKSLVIYSVSSAIEKRYSNIWDYAFSDNGSFLVMQKSNDTSRGNVIVWCNLLENREVSIGHGYKGKYFAFDTKGTQLAFLGEVNTDNHPRKSLLYYQESLDSARSLVDSSTRGMNGMDVDLDAEYISYNNYEGSIDYKPIPRFSEDGKKIFLSIRKYAPPNLEMHFDTIARVNIWSYKDETLRPLQSVISPLYRRNYTAVIYLNNKHKVIQLDHEGDKDYIKLDKGGNGDYGLLADDVEGDNREYWRSSAFPNIYLVSLHDGSRKLIRKRLKSLYWQFSPSGKYLIWYEGQIKSWLCYNIVKNTTVNISNRIPELVYKNVDVAAIVSVPEGVGGWLEKDTSVLVYDRHDIWKVDPEGVKNPLNITAGFGLKNNIVLRCINFKQDVPTPIGPRDTLLLSGFNNITKDRGFFTQLVTSTEQPKKKLMGPYTWSSYLYVGNEFIESNFENDFLLKAKRNRTYVLQRMNATNYPNLFATHDFKNFLQLTNLAPQKDYNWYTSELIHWPMLDGQKGEGLLYKPENFDPRKKYPIIFYYYEKYADELNLFIHPDLSRGMINIPWFVSNGYLVCVPDIYYKIGRPGESAYNSVFSAALYLATKPWVDGHKMGLQGHSFGGYETNYIVTRTALFAAASSAAGPTELISLYGNIDGLGSIHFFFENGQGRIGASLWQRPELYIQNSPIFRADKVNTPLLIMHNKADVAVAWSTQAAPWFTALRRLHKKVWMLEYDGEGHTIQSPTNKLDYTIRLSQFFDYFLKEKPVPLWMVEGIPAYMKGVYSGLQIDSLRRKP